MHLANSGVSLVKQTLIGMSAKRSVRHKKFFASW